MRIGIFVATQIRESMEKTRLNLLLLGDAFPTAKIIGGIWSYEKEKTSLVEKYVDDILYIDEPHIHYDLYQDNPDAVANWNYQKKLLKPNERHNHQTKQILAHNELMKKYENSFDVIVRIRWDATVGINIDFMKFVEECNDIPATISVSTRSDYHRSIMTIGEVSSWEYPFIKHKSTKTNEIKIGPTSEMLLDNGIIMHRAQDWNCDLVDSLHMNKKLLAAEFGWYQVLVTGTSHHRWKHYDGGATITRVLMKQDREILEKYESICNYD